jgi:hypothetical protein
MAFATVYDQYADANKRLARGERLFFTGNGVQERISDRETLGSRRLRYYKVGVFTGEGTSHSWLWFVDLFERMGFNSLSLLNEFNVQEGGLEGLDVLAISGGDTFAIAAALGKSGAREIRRFIENGGVYIGSCAGAYLAMNSSKSPLNLFNYTAVKITNLSKYLPQCREMPYKFSTAYGCCFVFHPVRESIGLHVNGKAPFASAGVLTAPLYGGPAMIAPDGAQVLAQYDAFTNKTVFLVDEALAYETLIGKAAAIRAQLGCGSIYLLGPHLEHPHYPEANGLIADAILWDAGRSSHGDPAHRVKSKNLSESDSRDLIMDLKRELSNSRIVAAGLELSPIRWLIGAKYYEPEKIRVFLDSMWLRLKVLEARDRLCATECASTDLRTWATEITRMLRLMKNELDQEHDTLPVAGQLFALLKKLTAAFLHLYFLNVSEPY